MHNSLLYLTYFLVESQNRYNSTYHKQTSDSIITLAQGKEPFSLFFTKKTSITSFFLLIKKISVKMLTDQEEFTMYDLSLSWEVTKLGILMDIMKMLNLKSYI